jgi:hypothetical protein
MVLELVLKLGNALGLAGFIYHDQCPIIDTETVEFVAFFGQRTCIFLDNDVHFLESHLWDLCFRIASERLRDDPLDSPMSTT